MIGKLISYIIFFVFLVVVCSAGLSFLAYKFGEEKLPMEDIIKTRLMDKVFPPDTVIIPDTMLTAEQLLNLELHEQEKDLIDEWDRLDQEKEGTIAYRDSLDDVLASLQSSLALREEQVSESVNSMAKLLDPMKPASAAPIISELDDLTIIRVLSRVKERQAAKILEAMDQDRAIEIMTKMSKGVK